MIRWHVKGLFLKTNGLVKKSGFAKQTDSFKEVQTLQEVGGSDEIQAKGAAKLTRKFVRGQVAYFMGISALLAAIHTEAMTGLIRAAQQPDIFLSLIHVVTGIAFVMAFLPTSLIDRMFAGMQATWSAIWRHWQHDWVAYALTR